MRSQITIFATSLGLSLTLACDPNPGEGEGEGEVEVPAAYEFESRFEAGESSVAYTGQVGRHTLLSDMKSFIGNISDTSYTGEGDIAATVAADLEFFYDYANLGGTGGDDIGLVLAGGEPLAQATYGDIGSPVSLRDKMPENDASFAGGVVGYGDGTLAPDEVATDLFARLGALVEERTLNGPPTDPSGAAIPEPFLTAEGVDLQQLIQKFLTGAVAYSQGSDDYLDYDEDGKGLLSENTTPVDGKPYTALEHAWDEGFGYWGGARNLGDFTDDEIAAKGGRDGFANGYNDANGDGAIDLTSELNVGHAVNAAKRDRAATGVDFTAEAWDAFRAGRTLIVNTDGKVEGDALETLQGHSDTIILAWEKAITATVIHYINNVTADMNAFGTEGYSFADHAKNWSELKGFALVLQFNPRTPLSADDIESLHLLIGDAPVLETAAPAAVEAYLGDLELARDLLQETHGFSDENTQAW